MSSLEPQIEANKRLIVLRALGGVHDGRLNETMIQSELDIFGYRMPRDDLRAILRWLEERDAIRIEMAAGVLMIATITRKGQDHIDLRGAPIPDVARPGRP